MPAAPMMSTFMRNFLPSPLPDHRLSAGWRNLELFCRAAYPSLLVKLFRALPQ